MLQLALTFAPSGPSFETPAVRAACISTRSRRAVEVGVAAADGSPCAPGVQEPVPEHGAPSVHPKIPNSRRGRVASPHVQGREVDVFVAIDVSKDRLDICVRPSGETFAVTRDDEGLERLVERLRALSPALIALEATGGYETVVASALAAAQLPLAVINPRQIRDFARSTGKLAKTDRLDAAAPYRPFRRSHSPARAARGRRRSAGAGRAGGGSSRRRRRLALKPNP